MAITLKPLAYVRGGRAEMLDDNWGEVRAVIEIDGDQFTPDTTAGLATFSHLLVVYHFHQADPAKITTAARHPRNNPAWPKIGIFAQRAKNRPNHLGVSACRLLKVDGLQLHVQGLDAIADTPVLDIKPYMRGFEPCGTITEPDWTREIMANYW